MSRYFPQDTEYFSKLPGYPSQERMKKGPVALIECNQWIPCNPCESSCRQGAITVGSQITNLPVLDEEKCIGCGICAAACPGQAVRIIDLSKEEGIVAFPYEYLPAPQKGQIGNALGRDGSVLGQARVVRVDAPKAYDHTMVVWVAVDKEIAKEVCSFGGKD